MKHRMKLSLPPKLSGKADLGPSYFTVKISLPITRLMPYYAEIDCSRPLIA
jgi:hypothetical protein